MNKNITLFSVKELIYLSIQYAECKYELPHNYQTKGEAKLAKIITILVILSLAATTNAQILGMKRGQGGSEVQGAVGPGGSVAEYGLQTCDSPLGVATIVEPQDFVLASLQSYQLQSPTSLLRMMIQQSNCFLVVDRGLAMQNMMQERSLSDSGQLRSGANIGEGQMIAADFVFTSDVVISDNNAGGAGIGAAIGGIFGDGVAAVGALVGAAAKTKEAQTTLLVTDARSGLQVAAAEGSAKKSDFALGAVLGSVGLGGYTSTDQGKVVAASFLDNYNNIVLAIRNQPSLHRDMTDLSDATSSGGSVQAGAVFNAGDLIGPKLARLPVFASPDTESEILYEITKGDGAVYLGEEINGFLNVEGADGQGWVRSILATGI